MIEIPKQYDWDIRIASYDVGQDRLLRLSNQLKLQQEVGERHLSGVGLDFQALYERGMVFVLTKTNSVIHRAPQLGEDVRLRTWHRSNKGVQFFRCYQFLDAEGTPLIESVTAFALVDAKEHRLLRPSVFEQLGIGQQPDRFNGCPDPGKLRLPDALVPQGQRQIRWSDTDVNGHLNNTNYADILCDFLPGGMRGRRITGFSITYIKEVREGETLEIAAAEEDGTAYMRAQQTNSDKPGPCFEARLTYVPAG